MKTITMILRAQHSHGGNFECLCWFHFAMLFIDIFFVELKIYFNKMMKAEMSERLYAVLDGCMLLK